MSSFTVKPGFDATPGNRNRRVNRFAQNDNRSLPRHREAAGTTIGFSAPDLINDSGNDLGKFYADVEQVRVEGSTGQDGDYVASSVAAGQIETVEQTITLEAAGAPIRVKSLANRNQNRFT